MLAFVEYKIPFKGLKDGIHLYHFKVDSEFFKHFENSLISDCLVHIDLEFDKRPGLMILNFQCRGHLLDNCDKCLNIIEIPISVDHRIMINFGEGESTDEVVYIPELEHALQIEDFIYEILHLSIPLKKQRNCEDENFEFCDKEMLSLYQQNEKHIDDNAIWNDLKNIKF